VSTPTDPKSKTFGTGIDYTDKVSDAFKGKRADTGNRGWCPDLKAWTERTRLRRAIRRGDYD
jgi:hypothetical protein